MPATMRLGPYEGVTLDENKTYPNGRTLRFISYSAYNAMGLIGTEKNGFAILDEDEKQVLVDEVGRRDGMMGRTPKEFTGKSDQQILDELKSKSWPEMVEFINSSPRARYTLRAEPQAQEKPLGLHDIPKVFFSDLVENKAEFAKRSKEFLKNLAKVMNLPKDSFSVRYNAGGPAVSGEATLHADNFYVQIHEGRKGADILYRSCKSQNDFTGGQNRYIQAPRLAEMNIFEVANELSQVAKPAPKSTGMSL
ncbi:hypothetical protein CL689_06340 [Candidatus Saccharibacteria bacterium]|nr:hypothetical protein [Candidatus Saccharibacteria bacterium]|tara:strand:+ start:2189 stop:2941 length:753 start_codon:yes stop_codon:yes gene_type:complete